MIYKSAAVWMFIDSVTDIILTFIKAEFPTFYPDAEKLSKIVAISIRLIKQLCWQYATATTDSVVDEET